MAKLLKKESLETFYSIQKLCKEYVYSNISSYHLKPIRYIIILFFETMNSTYCEYCFNSTFSVVLNLEIMQVVHVIHVDAQ